MSKKYLKGILRIRFLLVFSIFLFSALYLKVHSNDFIAAQLVDDPIAVVDVVLPEEPVVLDVVEEPVVLDLVEEPLPDLPQEETPVPVEPLLEDISEVTDEQETPLEEQSDLVEENNAVEHLEIFEPEIDETDDPVENMDLEDAELLDEDTVEIGEDVLPSSNQTDSEHIDDENFFESDLEEIIAGEDLVEQLDGDEDEDLEDELSDIDTEYEEVLEVSVDDEAIETQTISKPRRQQSVLLDESSVESFEGGEKPEEGIAEWLQHFPEITDEIIDDFMVQDIESVSIVETEKELIQSKVSQSELQVENRILEEKDLDTQKWISPEHNEGLKKKENAESNGAETQQFADLNSDEVKLYKENIQQQKIIAVADKDDVQADTKVVLDKALEKIHYEAAGVTLSLSPKTGNYKAEVSDGLIQYLDEDDPNQLLVYHFLDEVMGPDGVMRSAQKEWVVLLESPLDDTWIYEWNLDQFELYDVEKNAETDVFSITPKGYDSSYSFLIPRTFYIDANGEKHFDIDLEYDEGVFRIVLNNTKSLEYPLAIDPTIFLPIGAADLPGDMPEPTDDDQMDEEVEVLEEAEADIPLDPLKRFARLPLGFEINMGQVDDAIRFMSSASQYHLSFYDDEVHYDLYDEERQVWDTYRQSFVGARSVSPTAENILPGKSNYFMGDDPDQWKTNIDQFTTLRYEDLYSGVDLTYMGTKGALKYQFEVDPRTDYRQIELEYSLQDEEGGSVPVSLALDDEGRLIVSHADGFLIEEAPYVYQIDGENISAKRAQFELRGGGRFGFQIEKVQSGLPLIIDPLLNYSSYLGGAGIGESVDVFHVDDFGALYMASQQDIGQNPTPVTGAGSSFTIIKMNPSASAVLMSITVSGTSSPDVFGDAVVDADGNIIVVGTALSNDFPVINELQGARSGTQDMFISKIAAAGDSLLFSTYYGGTDVEQADTVAIDSLNNIYVAGIVESSDFPTSTPFQAALAGAAGTDAFFMKVNASDNSLAYASYLGGSAGASGEVVTDMVVDSSQRIHIVGGTDSVSFPLVSEIQTSQGGGDGFFARVAADGQSLEFSTYIGGAAADEVKALALAPASKVVLAGDTASLDFPLTAGVLQNFNRGDDDGFVTVVNAGLTAYEASTYIGGFDNDAIESVVVDSQRQYAVVGTTGSISFPSKTSFYDNFPSDTDTELFVSLLTDDLSGLVYSTFQGGADADRATSAIIDDFDRIYVAGSTSSNDYRTESPFQAARNGASDGFFFSISRRLEPVITGASGDTEITINEWEPLDGVNKADEGALITDYTFEVYEDAALTVPFAFADVVSPTPADTTITGLTNGENYFVRIQAVSSFATSPYSNVLELTPSAGVVDLELIVTSTDYGGDNVASGITDTIIGGANDFTPGFANSGATNYSFAKSYDFTAGSIAAVETDLGAPVLKMLAGGATVLPLGDDEISADQNFPFPVLVYGETQTKFRVLSNGAVVTGGPDDIIDTSSSGCCSGNNPIENEGASSGDDFFLAIFQSDLDPSSNGTISYGLNNADPTEFVIFFDDVEGFGFGSGAGGFTGQLVFRQASVPSSTPGQITSVVATPNDGQITLDFSLPVVTPAVSDVIVEVDSGEGFVVVNDGVASVSQIVLTGLTNGVPHAIRLKAQNSVADGEYSDIVVSTPQAPDGKVEIHVFSNEAVGNDMVTGVADHINGGGNDINSFGPTVSEYAGPNAGGAQVARGYFFFDGSNAVIEDTAVVPTKDVIPGAVSAGIGDEEISADIVLPFDITVYGTTYNTIAIGDNGFVYGAGANGVLDSSDTAFNSDSMDAQGITDTDDHLFAGVWHDLDPDANGTITHGVTGSAPNRVYIVDFDDVASFGGTDGNSFQIKFFESVGTPESFTVGGVENPTDLLEPAGFQATCDPAAGADLENYRLQVASDAGFASIVYDSGETAMAACTPGTLSPVFTVPELVPDNTTYRWRIKFWTAAGTEAAATFSPGTDTLSFFPDAQPPVGTVQLVGGATDVTDPLVDLELQAFDVNGHGLTATGGVAGGIAAYRVSNDNITFSPEVLIPFPYTNGNTITINDWDITDPAFGGNSNDGQKTVYIKLRDRVGNLSNSTWTQTLDADFNAGMVVGGEVTGDSVQISGLGLGTIGAWTTAGADPMPGRRRGPASGVINGKMYVAGGEDNLADEQDSLFIFDPAAAAGARWTTGPTMPAPRAFIDGVVHNDLFYVFGGTDLGGASQDDVYVFDPTANAGLGQWSTLTASGADRSFYASALIGDNWYIFGGNDAIRTDTTLRYHIPTDTWTIAGLTPMPVTKDGHTANSVGALAYVFGGSRTFGVPDLKEVLIFDPAGNAGAGSWISGTDSPNDHSFSCSVVQGSEIVVISNSQLGNETLVDSYDPAGNAGLGSWDTSFVDLPNEQTDCAAEIVDNTLVLAGGFDGANRLSSVLYGPSSLGTTATVTSSVFDAHSSTEFQDIQWTKTTPVGTSLLMSYRACNVADCSDGVFAPTAGTDALSVINFSLTPFRYFQWQATLNGNGLVTPSLGSVAVEYNGAIPVVFGFAAGGGGGGGGRWLFDPPADDPTDDPVPIPPAPDTPPNDDGDVPEPPSGGGSDTPVPPSGPEFVPPDEGQPPSTPPLPPFDFDVFSPEGYRPSADTQRAQDLLFKAACINTIRRKVSEARDFLNDYQEKKIKRYTLPVVLKRYLQELNRKKIYKPTLIDVFASLAPEQLQPNFEEVLQVLRKADEQFYDLAELSKVIVLSTTICESDALQRDGVRAAQNLDSEFEPEWYRGYLDLMSGPIVQHFGQGLQPWHPIIDFDLIDILDAYMTYIEDELLDS
ncbi:MAG: hypothetical protein P1V18_03935 [Candidatus Gracilibacteria bacterium]|nr:hypothetical protein [Candidatus Gracilibacteria bacterium]